MRVLVTGATGFIGRHVLAQFRGGGHDVKGLSRDAAPAEIVAFDPEACIDLAWEGIPDYSPQVCRRNLDRSIAFFDFLSRETDCKKMVVSGSCFEYAKAQGECLESETVRPNSFISWSKLALYDYLALACRQASIDLVWFRIFYVFGSGQKPHALMPTLARSLAKGEPANIRNPRNANDFIYVADVARAFRLAVERKTPSGVYNLGSGKATSVFDVYQAAREQIAGAKRLPPTLPEPAEALESACLWANIEKSEKILGWKPEYSLAQGIQAYLREINEPKQPVTA